MFDELGIMMIMMYPIIPMFLIQLHFAIGFWRRLGTWTYLVIFLEWLPIGLLLLTLQGPLLYYQNYLGTPFLVLGVILLILAAALHGWTAKLIGLKATIGYTELKPESQPSKQTLITKGPFAVVRHPSYWAHILVDVGFYLITGIVAIGVIAIVDLAVIYFVVIRLEDRELVDRFGEEYREYQKRVPRFFPKIRYREKKGDNQDPNLRRKKFAVAGQGLFAFVYSWLSLLLKHTLFSIDIRGVGQT